MSDLAIADRSSQPKPVCFVVGTQKKKLAKVTRNLQQGQHAQDTKVLLQGAEIQVQGMLFFQPVVDGRTASYTTILGENISFDFLAQPFRIKTAEYSQETMSVSSVTAVSEGELVTCGVSNIPFDSLSDKLHVWIPGELCYYVSRPM